MTELQEKQLAFLEETAGFYNTDNRALSNTGDCVYVSTDKSPGCAIGRHIPAELAKSLDDAPFSGINNDDIFNAIPDSLRELTKMFLMNIQDLHDTAWNWDEKGLTAAGRQKVLAIRTDFNLF